MTARLGTVIVLPLLAACAVREPPPGTAAALTDAMASARASVAAVGAPAAALPAVASGRVPAATGGVPVASRPGPRAARAAPARADALVGAPASAVRAAFGEPDLIRREGPAEVWLFRGETCHLDVVLYRDTTSAEARVAHAAARAAGLARTAEAACLREIAAGPPAQPSAAPDPAILHVSGDAS